MTNPIRWSQSVKQDLILNLPTKNRTQPMQNPDWFPLEFFTQGVEVDFVLVTDMILWNLSMSMDL